MNSKFFPEETICKILITSPCRFVGQYQSNHMLFTHSWMSQQNLRANYSNEESPISINGFIFAFETDPIPKKSGITIPDYSFFGNTICSYLSLLFGKKFENHGLTESFGNFRLPNLFNTSYSIYNHKLPFNSFEIRSSFPVSLYLNNLKVYEEFLTNKDINTKFRQTFTKCCHFYWQSLKIVEFDPEIAYLHLLTAGEILSNYFDYKNVEIIDPETFSILESVEKNLCNGKKKRNVIESKLYSIKSKFTKSILKFIDAEFFIEKIEDKFHKRFEINLIKKNIKASYDLRSKFTHTGFNFGQIIKPDYKYHDLPYGEPCVNDKEINRVLKYVPLYGGLEKIIRYVLLRFYESEMSLKIKDIIIS